VTTYSGGLGWEWLTTTRVPHVCPNRTLEHVYIMRKLLDGEWKDIRDLHGITSAHYLTILHAQEHLKTAVWRMV
jgi:hypothetical protein